MNTAAERLERLANDEFPDIAAMLDMLADHHSVAADAALSAAVHVIKCRLVEVWDEVESVAADARKSGIR